jgi:hypothetical protein
MSALRIAARATKRRRQSFRVTPSTSFTHEKPIMNTPVTVRETSVQAPALDLDALHAMTFAELDALYRRSPAPKSIPALNGNREGRALALYNTSKGPLAKAVRAFTKSPLFFWSGKNFSSQGPEQGEGINRINLFRYKPLWFPFKTSFAPSLIDGKPCFQLEYGLPQNPPGIRHIIDELREVAPNLYLGPGQLVFDKLRPFTVLYFAVAHQRERHSPRSTQQQGPFLQATL